eukprot:GHUV01010836.1.p1 GENE.GHUV01010836.1~~GHUV01010836.1.p1  ORF type:complete len:576 (+),score=142.43 GHUV01010836.1:158-1885(+)
MQYRGLPPRMPGNSARQRLGYVAQRFVCYSKSHWQVGLCQRSGHVHVATQGAAAFESAQNNHEVTQQASTRSAASSTVTASCSLLEQDASLLRRILATDTAVEALDLYVQEAERQQQSPNLTDADAELLLRRSLQTGNATLALSIHRQLCTASRAKGLSDVSHWPSVTLQHTETLVTGLCQQLRVSDALAVLSSIRSQGMQGNAEVHFGHVVNSPLPPRRPLALVEPQEGCKVVSDANSRYEFELFSGTVTACSSGALQLTSNPLLAAARLVGLVQQPPPAAVHELVVQAPDGSSRAYRVGTAAADVPAQTGDRITVVCAPNKGNNKLKRFLFSTSPPGARPGQPMLISNHRTGTELQLLRPPAPSGQTGVPGWVLPAVVLLAGSDAASGLIDPALPMMITGGIVAAAGSVIAGNTMLLPRLKQLPNSTVKLDSIRQQLLAQHAVLNDKATVTMQEAADDVRTLARLWQLQQKMESVDNFASSYKARIGRVAAVVAGTEQRLAKRLELLDGYARVMNMIEIEVEMDLQVPIGELDGLGLELEKLSELESIREEWQLQAQAQDEVEKLLRQVPAVM